MSECPGAAEIEQIPGRGGHPRATIASEGLPPGRDDRQPSARPRAVPVLVAGLLAVTVALVGAAALRRTGSGIDPTTWPRLLPETLWKGELWRLPAGALAGTSTVRLLLAIILTGATARTLVARRGIVVVVSAFVTAAITCVAMGARASRPETWGAVPGGGAAAGGAAMALLAFGGRPAERRTSLFWAGVALALGGLEGAFAPVLVGTVGGVAGGLSVGDLRHRPARLALLLAPLAVMILAVLPRWETSPIAGMARDALASGDCARTEAALNVAMRLLPPRALGPELLEEAGDLACESGREDLARGWYADALAAGGAFGAAHKLGMLELSSGAVDTDAFEAALAIGCDGLDRDLYARGIAWLKAGRRDIAIAALREAGRGALGDPEG